LKPPPSFQLKPSFPNLDKAFFERFRPQALDPTLPIGLFDSGVGGLTVMREVASLLPHEDLIYLGDTARLPYGNKSAETILRFSVDNTLFLLEHKVKALVVSCHTACSHAFRYLESLLPIPVFGVSEPGVAALLKSTRTKTVAILGTSSTIRSGYLQSLMQAQDPSVTIYPIACPLFVPLVEEGLQNHPAALQMAQYYLTPYLDKGIDAALLACTHYPLLSPILQSVLGNSIRLIEPAQAAALQLRSYLEAHSLSNPNRAPPSYRFFASDDPEKFKTLANLFFSKPIQTVEQRFFLQEN
jgi:glutamate racemase